MKKLFLLMAAGLMGFTANAASLGDLYAQAKAYELTKNATYEMTLTNAVITYVSDLGEVVIQDETGGVYGIWSASPAPVVGDEINGTINIVYGGSSNNGMPSFKFNDLSGLTIEEGPAPEPYVIKNVNEVLDGSLAMRLVKITDNVVPFDNQGTRIIFVEENEDYRDGFKAFNGLNVYPFSGFPENTSAVIGILQPYPSGCYQLAPRSMADIETETVKAISLADAMNLASGESALVNLDNAIVTYSNSDSGNLFLQQTDVAAMVGCYENVPASGTVLNGRVEMTCYMPGLFIVENFDSASASEGELPAPVFISEPDMLNGYNMNRLVTVSSAVMPMTVDGGFVNFEGYDNLVCFDYLETLPAGYEFPENIESITGIFTFMPGGLFSDDSMGVGSEMYIIAPISEEGIVAATVYSLRDAYANIQTGETALVKLEDAVVTFSSDIQGLGYMQETEGAINFAADVEELPAIGTRLNGTVEMTNAGFGVLFINNIENLEATPGESPEPMVISSVDDLNGTTLNRLVSLSDEVLPFINDGFMIRFEGLDNLSCFDYFSVLGDYLFPENVVNVAGVFTLNPAGLFAEDDDMGVSANDQYVIAPRSLADITVATGIQSIESNDAAVEYFNLQGVRVSNPENGVYIMRQGNKVSKVVVNE